MLILVEEMAVLNLVISLQELGKFFLAEMRRYFKWLRAVKFSFHIAKQIKPQTQARMPAVGTGGRANPHGCPTLTLLTTVGLLLVQSARDTL